MINPFQVLAQYPSLLIKQKPDLLEALTGCEIANKYNVYIAGPDGKKLSGTKSIYKVKEKGDCLSRQCGNWVHTDFKVKEKNSDAIIMKIDKPCGCFNCPCCFPEMIISDGVGNVIGRVQSRCSICGDNFNVYDHQDKLIGTIYGSCCQIGKYCMLPCSPCDKIMFEITDFENPQNPGSVIKKWSGCAKELLTDADNFILNFPLNSSIQKRMLYFGAIFLIDFLFFEEKGNGSHNNGVN